MVLVVCGLVLVGVSDIVFHTDSSTSRDINAVLTGDLLIIMAQVIVAIQMVYEQRVLSKYDAHPLQAVGLEGIRFTRVENSFAHIYTRMSVR